MVVMLLAGPILLFQSKALWGMTSSNAITWNATLNTSATGFDVIPLFLVVILVFIGLGCVATLRGFGDG